MKRKKYISLSILVVLLVVYVAAMLTPAIETKTWVLTSAQRADTMLCVAHQSGADVADDPMFAMSEEVDLTCVAKDGKLTVTDKTNHKIYTGTYEANRSWDLVGQTYTIVIDRQQGRANISSGYNRSLFVSVGGYYLNFFPQ